MGTTPGPGLNDFFTAIITLAIVIGLYLAIRWAQKKG